MQVCRFFPAHFEGGWEMFPRDFEKWRSQHYRAPAPKERLCHGLEVWHEYTFQDVSDLEQYILEMLSAEQEA